MIWLTALGHAIAFQGVHSQWHNILLGVNGEASAEIQVGQNQLPNTPDGKLEPLSESHDDGVHEFVLVTASPSDIPTDITSLVAWVTNTPSELYRIAVQFVK